jgi:hypothetical protein
MRKAQQRNIRIYDCATCPSLFSIELEQSQTATISL